MKDESQTYPAEEFHDVSSDDEGEHGPERPADENFAALVSHGRSFIEESTALQKLREDFKKFIIPPRRNGGLEAEPFLKIEPWFRRWIYFVFTRTPGGELKYKVVVGIVRAYMSLKWLLSWIGLLEETIPKNHQRFRWTNMRVSIF